MLAAVLRLDEFVRFRLCRFAMNQEDEDEGYFRISRSLIGGPGR
jgi:hypothetical protein